MKGKQEEMFMMNRKLTTKKMTEMNKRSQKEHTKLFHLSYERYPCDKETEADMDEGL